MIVSRRINKFTMAILWCEYWKTNFMNPRSLESWHLFLHNHEDGGINPFRNLGVCLLIYRASRPRKLEL